MRMKTFKKSEKSILLCIILAVFLLFGMVTVGAETEPVTETYAIESFVTDATEDTENPTSSTGEETTEETLASDATEVSEETEPEKTYPEPLPDISSDDIVIPTQSPIITEDENPSLFWGFVAWICVGVGVAVILAVLLTTKTRAYRGGGKKRYSTGDKISGKKRLLSDKYYNSKRK